MKLTFRSLYLLGFIFCLFLLAAALFFQFVLGLEPCPLCVLSRISVIFLAIIYFIAIVHNPNKTAQKIYSTLTMLCSILGATITTRHIWIQHLPPELVPDCGPSFDYLTKNLPFTEAISTILNGSGECAEINWSFLDLSLPAWTISAFGILIILNILAIYTPSTRPILTPP